MDVLLCILYFMYLPLSLKTYTHLNNPKRNPKQTLSLCLKWIMGIMSTFTYRLLCLLPSIPFITSVLLLGAFAFTLYVIMPDAQGHAIMNMMFGKILITINGWYFSLKSFVMRIFAQIFLKLVEAILENNSNYSEKDLSLINEQSKHIEYKASRMKLINRKMQERKTGGQQNKMPDLYFQSCAFPPKKNK